MKFITIILIILIFDYSVYCQISKKSNNITFSVSNVKKATTKLDEVYYKNALQTSINYEIESYQIELKNKKLIPTDANAFVCALHIAFAQHRPIIISPDMIWLLIVQGISIHIQENNAILKNDIVTFQNIKQITIQNNDFTKGNENNNWSIVFPQFTDSIKKYLQDSIYNLFVPKFSTTTIKEKNAFEISLMSSVDKYFEFNMESFCGIPEITLEGKTSDWQLIAKSIKNIKIKGLEDWCLNLNPILNEFVEASKGKIDTLFWKSIYKWNDKCVPFISGWILNFFPYVRYSNKYYNNILINGDSFVYGGISPCAFPSGLAKTEMIWKVFELNKMREYKMELYSGFMGISQDTISKAIRPEISWAIRDVNSNIIKNNFTSSKNNTIEIKDSIIEIVDYNYFDNSSLLDTLIVPFDEIDVSFDIIQISHLDNSNTPIITKNNIEKPIIFPHKFNDYEESRLYLSKFISNHLSEKRIKFDGKISFIITWTGTIDKVKIIESNNQEYNEQIISIIDNIRGCKPGSYMNKLVSTEIYMNLIIK